ncbi:protocadherin-like wing polarity protein stan [Microplitis mediator]|uniref:protocadherin-like wing polarity protein stan n=1 Tax=Microplitis mediator TaxID=375433 RepID=UPI00255716AC|nr:protocadherin-like wing polarity protein stan [Microplitis mediator]
MYINLKLHIFLFITSVSCQQCSFEKPDRSKLSEDEIKYGIILPSILDTDQPGKPVLTYITTGVTKIIQSTTTSASQRYFMTPSFDSDIFQVTLANDFKDYEIYETKAAMSIRVYFECGGGINKTDFEIIQPINDTNNHDPQFVNLPYSYKLSMPLPQNIPLHLLSGISARDVDLSNQKITFFLNNSDVNSQGFFAAWLSTDQTDNKLHRASLTTTAVINLKNDFSFKIYARDTGTVPRTVSTSVTIIVDKDNSVLRFEKPIYIADCSDLQPEVANGTIFTFDQGDISLSAGADNSVKYFLQEESREYQDNFYLIKKSDASVRLQLINPPKKIFNESFVLLTLNASKPGADDVTVIHISFPGRSTSKNSSISSTEANKTEPYNDDSTSTVTITVLGVFLAIVTIVLVVMIVLYWRRTRSIVTEKVNGIQEKKEEMIEIDRDSPHPVSSGRRSVAFNDIVEEIKIARL